MNLLTLFSLVYTLSLHQAVARDQSQNQIRNFQNCAQKLKERNLSAYVYLNPKDQKFRALTLDELLAPTDQHFKEDTSIQFQELANTLGCTEYFGLKKINPDKETMNALLERWGKNKSTQSESNRIKNTNNDECFKKTWAQTFSRTDNETSKILM
ncbi:MAG: hypothetical protein KA715_10665 [Xanthomonadaceae bacterium]|nr:hypothetical protein [Xanthomonadaceae bacterium]